MSLQYRDKNFLDSAMADWVKSAQTVIAQRIEKEVSPMIKEKVEAIIREESMAFAIDIKRFLRIDEASERLMICIGDDRDAHRV